MVITTIRNRRTTIRTSTTTITGKMHLFTFIAIIASVIVSVSLKTLQPQNLNSKELDTIGHGEVIVEEKGRFGCQFQNDTHHQYICHVLSDPVRLNLTETGEMAPVQVSFNLTVTVLEDNQQDNRTKDLAITIGKIDVDAINDQDQEQFGLVSGSKWKPSGGGKRIKIKVTQTVAIVLLVLLVTALIIYGCYRLCKR